MLSIAAELMEFEIPTMSILTIVENSVKHGACLNSPLMIYIKVRLLISEEEKCVNITISDNGKGFSRERIGKFNKAEGYNYSGEHVGIYNIKHSLALIYDNKSSISFSNQANGACVEIFIPYNC
jgi:two-component system, sensor histidine kinase YesM